MKIHHRNFIENYRLLKQLDNNGQWILHGSKHDAA